MARKSRKNIVTEPEIIKNADKVYRTALYARISVETERKREADTIGNQLLLLKDYVTEHSDMSVFDVYIVMMIFQVPILFVLNFHK